MNIVTEIKPGLVISRKLKPQIPLKGKHNIFLQDEWEFEKSLQFENYRSGYYTTG